MKRRLETCNEISFSIRINLKGKEGNLKVAKKGEHFSYNDTKKFMSKNPQRNVRGKGGKEGKGCEFYINLIYSY